MISFKLCGTTICLHFSFFAMLCLYFQLEREGYGVSCLFTALVHETGHLIAFAVQKAAPKELHFQLGGIRLIPPDEPLSFPGELFTLAAGSMVSLYCGSFLYYKDSQTALPHLLTGLFSLLPLPGLDGGEIVSLFQSRFFPEKEYFFRITG
ncbi:MAG: hypothetical protein IJD13_09265, partial [Oscillospiraceae bacterium]|nr:hypothetical protein [Oscillospiraceae bacterium]